MKTAELYLEIINHEVVLSDLHTGEQLGEYNSPEQYRSIFAGLPEDYEVYLSEDFLFPEDVTDHQPTVDLARQIKEVQNR